MELFYRNAPICECCTLFFHCFPCFLQTAQYDCISGIVSKSSSLSPKANTPGFSTIISPSSKALSFPRNSPLPDNHPEESGIDTFYVLWIFQHIYLSLRQRESNQIW